MNLHELKENDQIIISDGTKEPPKHHTRKHFAWRLNNRTCLVHRYEPQFSRLGVKDKPNSAVVDCLQVNSLTVQRVKPEQELSSS